MLIIIAVSKNSNELEYMLDVVNGYSINFEVKFDMNKSQVMIVNRDHMDEDKYVGRRVNTQLENDLN